MTFSLTLIKFEAGDIAVLYCTVQRRHCGCFPCSAAAWQPSGSWHYTHSLCETSRWHVHSSKLSRPFPVLAVYLTSLTSNVVCSWTWLFFDTSYCIKYFCTANDVLKCH